MLTGAPPRCGAIQTAPAVRAYGPKHEYPPALGPEGQTKFFADGSARRHTAANTCPEGPPSGRAQPSSAATVISTGAASSVDSRIDSRARVVAVSYREA